MFIPALTNEELLAFAQVFAKTELEQELVKRLAAAVDEVAVLDLDNEELRSLL